MPRRKTKQGQSPQEKIRRDSSIFVQQVATAYFKDFHFLLIGVICLATSIQKWGLHRRVALRLVGAVGVKPAWLTLGFMSGCGFLSMWVHNTSAVTMVMPIAEAVLRQIRRAGEEGGRGGRDDLRLAGKAQRRNFWNEYNIVWDD